MFYLGKGGGAKASAGANVQDARKEMTKTKEQLEEEKKISLAIRYGILLPNLFWPTVRKNCFSDWEKLLKFEAEGREFSKFLRLLEQFIQTVKGQKKFWTRMFF